MTDDDFTIEFRWKEEVIYWEAGIGFVFDGGWGVDPLVTYVPDPATWDAVVPTWLQGRRDLIVARLRAEPGHIVEDDPDFQSLPAREVFRT